MKPIIAIIYSTFLRDELMYQTVQSILDNFLNNCILLVGNQSYKTDGERLNGFSNFCANNDNPCHFPIEYYNLPFDCGLSYARNFLVQKAKSLGCKYCILTADSIKFTEKYNFEPIINFLEEKDNRGIVGLGLDNRQYWVYNMELIPGHFFKLNKDNLKIINSQGIEFISCEVVANFFLAKTQCLIDNPWDNNLKMAEHEDIFWRLKQTKWKVYYTDYIKAQYINNKPTEYLKFRQRLYSEFKQKLQQKYKISGWLKYER